ncbi:YdbL family protein [Azospirillum sp. B506]|uniref:YdbL family protein n=1 Tax=Azospirillum sp. B506 TaxID=137721 RepID=UPI000344C245|nr:YdbL family protein [Azospirillum sp. B506]
MTSKSIDRRRFNRLALSTLTASLLAAALPQLALAQDALAAAKAAGQLGERPDGMVGVVPGAPASAQALAQQVNAQRLARYQEIAQGNGTALDKVQAVAGQQLIERTPTGQFVMTAAGQWQRK